MLDHDRDDDDDRLTREERAKLRRILDLISSEERQRAISRLIEQAPEVDSLLEAKRSTQAVYTFIGSFGKWIAAVVAAIVAIKGLFFGGLSIGGPK